MTQIAQMNDGNETCRRLPFGDWLGRCLEMLSIEACHLVAKADPQQEAMAYEYWLHSMQWVLQSGPWIVRHHEGLEQWNEEW